MTTQIKWLPSYNAAITRVFRHPAMKPITLAFLLILYAFVAYSSWGYDDEFPNIGLIESGKGVVEIVNTINSMDVHPPGSYLLNKWLFDLVTDWSLVRLIGAALGAFSIWLIWKESWKLSINKAFSFLVICLNPTLLLWVTGLRWYAYFVPLLNLLILLLLRNIRNKIMFWGIFFLLSTILFYVGYISMIIVPVIFLIALHLRKSNLKSELLTILLMSLVSILLCIPQLVIFFTVHLHHKGAQIASYAKSAAGLFLHIFSGQGSYPLSISGASLIIGNALLFCVAFVRTRTILQNLGSKLFAFGSVGLFLVKLTAKFRNLVVLSTAQGLFQSASFALIRNQLLKAVVIICFLIGNLWGVFNVISHQHTTKGSWNMPYSQIFNAVKQEAALCDASVLITSDPATAYHGKKLVKRVIYLIGNEHWAEEIDSVGGCILVLKTFRGSLSQQSYQQYLDFLAGKANHVTRVLHFGHDSDAGFKRMFDPDIPDYYADLLVIAGNRTDSLSDRIASTVK